MMAEGSGTESMPGVLVVVNAPTALCGRTQLGGLDHPEIPLSPLFHFLPSPVPLPSVPADPQPQARPKVGPEQIMTKTFYAYFSN